MAGFVRGNKITAMSLRAIAKQSPDARRLLRRLLSFAHRNDIVQVVDEIEEFLCEWRKDNTT